MAATWHVRLAETITSATEVLKGLDQAQSIFVCVANFQWVAKRNQEHLYHKHDQS